MELARDHRVLMPLAMRWQRLATAGQAPSVPSQLRRAASTERLFALRGAWWLCRLADDLDKARIRWVALKGPALATQIYGDPAQRTFRDLDILVDPASVGLAVAVARELGWQVRNEWQRVMDLTGKIDLGLRSACIGQPLLEIHRALCPDHAAVRFGSVAALITDEVKVGSRCVPALAREDAVTYVAWHGGKHLWMRLNWLLDLAQLLAKRDVPSDLLIARARQAGTEKSLRAGIQLCHALLNLRLDDIPPAKPEIEREARRIAHWAMERIGLGPNPAALGGRPWSYRWNFRKARVSDRKGSAIFRLKSLLTPVEPDVRWLGANRAPMLHYAARPFFVGRRVLLDLLGQRRKEIGDVR